MQVPNSESIPPLVPLRLLSVGIPAQSEEESVGETVQHLHRELQLNNVPHEIVVVDDGSRDGTWSVLEKLSASVPALRPIRNESQGFGRAVIKGIEGSLGDAVVVMVADESDNCAAVVRYWHLLNEGWECVFGSRFIDGGAAIDYPVPSC